MQLNRSSFAKVQRITVATLSVALTLGTTPVSAYAATSAELQSQLEAAQAESASYEQKALEAFQEYEYAQAQLEETEGKIATVQSEIDDKQVELEAAQDVLGQRVAADYKAGGVSLVSIIFESSNFEDLVTRISYASKVAASDAEQIQTVQTIQADLDSKKSELQAEEAQQQQLTASAEENASAMQAAQDEHAAYVASLSQDVQDALAAEEAARQAELQRQAEEAAAAVAAQAAQTSAAQTADSSSSNSSSTSDTTSSDNSSNSTTEDNSSAKIDSADYGSGIGGAINAALSKVGNSAYSYGASGPYYFDCSGLVWWAYQQAGISIPRGQRMSNGRSSSMVGWALDGGGWTTDASQLQAGDLMFWSYSGDVSNTYHVGMCIGGGMMVHSIPGGVQVASVNWQSSQFVGGGPVV